MDWFLYMLLTSVEPCYRFKAILKKEGYLKNYKKEKWFESSVEKARRILDDYCFPHESTPKSYWVRSQIIPNKKYLVNWYHADFIVCEYPWSIHGNICKHSIKVNWLYFNSRNSEPLCHKDSMSNTLNELPNIRIEPHNHSVYVKLILWPPIVLTQMWRNFISLEIICLDTCIWFNLSPLTHWQRPNNWLLWWNKCWNRPIRNNLWILNSQLGWMLLICIWRGIRVS